MRKSQDEGWILMSKQRILQTIHLLSGNQIAQTETVEHPAFVQKITGIDPFEQPYEAMKSFTAKMDIDWIYGLPRQAVRFAQGESTKDLGHGEYITQWGFTGSHWKPETGFTCEEDVLQFDPFADFSSIEQLHDFVRQGINQSCIADNRAAGEDFVVSGLYYTTLFQWFILTFGWEMFLITAGSEPEQFAHVIRRFADLSVEHAKVWAESELPFFFCHDDLAITRGLVFAKEWYVKYIFPEYERIFHEVKKRGKKIMFVSDGNYTELVDDIFAAGADGIMVDDTLSLPMLLQKYGREKVIVGNANASVLTFGSMDDVRREVRRCTDIGREYPGFVMKCSNDMPENIPLDNIACYFEEFHRNRQR